MSDRFYEYPDLYRQPGPLGLAYVPAATGTVDTLEAGDVLPGNVRTALAGPGASNEDLNAGFLLVPGPVLPEGVDIAALLRCPTGPKRRRPDSRQGALLPT